MNGLPVGTITNDPLEKQPINNSQYPHGHYAVDQCTAENSKFHLIRLLLSKHNKNCF